MSTSPIQLTNVIFNAATQSFEAVVAIHEHGQIFKYACAIDAPITMSFERAACGLARQARRRHQKQTGMRSITGQHITTRRMNRVRFDPVRWLERLINLPDARVA